MLDSMFLRESAIALRAAAEYRRSRAYHLAKAKTQDAWQMAESLKSADRASDVATGQITRARDINRKARAFSMGDSMLRFARLYETAGWDAMAGVYRDKARRYFAQAGI